MLAAAPPRTRTGTYLRPNSIGVPHKPQPVIWALALAEGFLQVQVQVFQYTLWTTSWGMLGTHLGF